MVRRRLLTLGAVAFLACVGTATAENRFHRPGKVDCLRCHTCHASDTGALTGAGQPLPTVPVQDQAQPYLLAFPSVTDTCMSCHGQSGAEAAFQFDMGGSTGVITAPKVFFDAAGGEGNELPGGNFYYSAHNDYHGHVLGDSSVFTHAVEDRAPTAAGLTGPSRSELTCVSCHDPHGEDTVLNGFRNLKSHVGPWQVDVTTSFTSGPEDQARLVKGVGSNANVAIDDRNHNVYREGDAGAGAFCAACHTGFHGGAGTSTIHDHKAWIRHPTDVVLPPRFEASYGVSSGVRGSYDFRYPIVTSSGSATVSAPWGVSGGESKVFCLSCHQVHASRYSKSLRWDPTLPSPAAGGGYLACGKCHAR